MPFIAVQLPLKRLALAQKAPPHVVILEYHLPDANGHSLIEKLNLVAPEAVAIVLSEYDFQAVADDLDRVKIETFLKKPFDLVDFEAALCSACTKPAGIRGMVNGCRK